MYAQEHTIGTRTKPRIRKRKVTWKDHTFPALRLMRDYSVKEAALKTKLSTDTIRRLRRMQVIYPRFETICKIVEAFGGELTVNWPQSILDEVSTNKKKPNLKVVGGKSTVKKRIRKPSLKKAA